jgi:hypothetical protein
MKTQKMGLENIKDLLGREEMKNIMAGSGSDADCGTGSSTIRCNQDTPETKNVPNCDRDTVEKCCGDTSYAVCYA